MDINNKLLSIGIGKRKTSQAITKIVKGNGTIYFNNLVINNFEVEQLVKDILLKFNLFSKVNIYLTVNGGGIYSRIDAIKLSIGKAILKMDANFKDILKKESFLNSDSRIKERRKYGLKKARKASQYSKR